MSELTTFDSTKESLLDLLRSAREGKTQLPDFQRGWVWNDRHIRELLASVSLGHPIGAVMMLQTGNPNVRLQPRPVEGVETRTEPERLILDGQQRITSLYQAFMSKKVVATRDDRKQPIKRWYYLNIEKALDPGVERDDAIVGLPEDRILRNFRNEPITDCSDLGKECALGLLPIRALFETTELSTWMMAYVNQEPAKMQERFGIWNRLMNEVLTPIQQYQIPIIQLRKHVSKAAVCKVFERVNMGGVALDVFELLTATFAAEDFRLRPDWEVRDRRIKKQKLLSGVEKTDFLQAVTLLTTYERRRSVLETGTAADKAPGVSCKKDDVLNLTVDDYKRWADGTEEGFLQAAKLLYGQYLFSARDLPYRTQLIPLAAIFVVLGRKAEQAGIRDRLTRWYWCGVLGELYGGSIETRFARDLAEVVGWLEGGPEPSTIVDANFAAQRLLTLRTRNSAAYKGISALLMRDGGRDFRTGDPLQAQLYFDDRVDIHHIFPKKWCEANGIDRGRMDSIVNKTPIAARTNGIISGHAPSAYLDKIGGGAHLSPQEVDNLLRTHAIEPHTLRRNDFEGFFRARRDALILRIESAMGKPVARDIAAPDASLYEGDEEDFDETE